MAITQAWRILLAIWLIVSGIVWIFGPTFRSAFAIEGLLAILAAVFLLLSVSERKA
jgi:drug/metabolite transporter (DMT)-like permease